MAALVMQHDGRHAKFAFILVRRLAALPPLAVMFDKATPCVNGL